MMGIGNPMDKEEDLAGALSVLKDLEKLIADDNQGDQELEALIMSIEASTEECIKTILVRKDILIKEAKAKYADKKAIIEVQHRDIKASIETCAKLIDAGTSIYNTKPDFAKQTWKSVGGLRITSTPTMEIHVNFPSLLKTIQNHGTIEVIESVKVHNAEPATNGFRGKTK